VKKSTFAKMGRPRAGSGSPARFRVRKPDEGVSFVIDMDRPQSERKRGLRASEQALPRCSNGARTRNRIKPGELAASIAHEGEQRSPPSSPNAEAGLRWLRPRPFSLEPGVDAGPSVEWIIDDGQSGGEVIRRVRALAKQDQPEKVPLESMTSWRETIRWVQKNVS